MQRGKLRGPRLRPHGQVPQVHVSVETVTCAGGAKPGHAAVDRDLGPGRRPGARGREIKGRLGDLFGADQPAVRLARFQRGPLGRWVRRAVKQAADPRRVGGARVDGVDPDPVGHAVGRHRAGQRGDRTLTGRVHRPLGKPGGRRDRAGIDHGGVCGGSQGRPGRAGDSRGAHHVDVEHAVPLFVGGLFDCPLGTGAGVVHQDVEPAERLKRGGDRGADGGVVGDTRRDVSHLGRQRARALGGQVKDHDGGAFGGERGGDGRADAGRTAGNECLQSLELVHVRLP